MWREGSGPTVRCSGCFLAKGGPYAVRQRHAADKRVHTGVYGTSGLDSPPPFDEGYHSNVS